MWGMPLLGTETECGILAPGRPELHPSMVSAAVVDGYPGPGTRARLDDDRDSARGAATAGFWATARGALRRPRAP